MRFLGDPGFVIEAETRDLIARFSTPPTGTRLKVINDLIRGLKADSLWSKLDVLFLFAAADSQAARLNWIGNVHNATVNGSPTFTADRGYTGAATTGLLTTDYVPNTHGAQNDASLGVWSRTAGTHANPMAGGNDGLAFFDIYPRTSGGNFAAALNQAANTQTANGDGSGFYLVSRRASNDVELYKDGASVASAATATNQNEQVAIYFCGTNNSGGATANTGECAAGLIGTGLTDTEAANLHTHLAAYMTAVGA